MKLKKSDGGQVGLFSDRGYKKGELIFELRGPIKAHATDTSIQIGKYKHIDDAYTQYINHNCNPSVIIEGRKVLAKQDIQSGDEITCNKNEMIGQL